MKFHGDHMDDRRARRAVSDRREASESDAADLAHAMGWEFSLGRGCYVFPEPEDPLHDLAPPVGFVVRQGPVPSMVSTSGWWRRSGEFVPMGWHAVEAEAWHAARRQLLAEAARPGNLLEEAQR